MWELPLPTPSALGALLLAFITLSGCDLYGGGGGDGNSTTPNTYTVTFNSNGAPTTPAPISDITYGTVIYAPVFGWTGNEFLGWYDTTLTTKYTFPLTITTNITLYAKWKFAAADVAANAEDFPGVAASSITIKTISTPAEFNTTRDTIQATAGNYVLNINDDIDVGSAAIIPAADANISLRGGGTIHKSSGTDYPLFFLAYSGSKLILRDATLKGHSSNNRALVYVGSGATFDMLGGEIKDNNASGNSGGGVHVGVGNFTMYGGTISGNEANYGGGVFVNAGAGGTFNKTGGTIYGKDSGANTNSASADNRGHAVFYDNGGTTKYRDTTANALIGLNSADGTNWNE
ncbi:hypothetical protein AGMMS50229_03750 [Campylobacterota bacterium]|nr:hypothetical protein AGMMS50229_03750 [Campylobacterota bacterium]